jgi:predicted DNA-binding transcriptional regulator AlpA
MHPSEYRKLNTPEAARYVGLSRSTLSKLRVFGGGPLFHKLGRRVVYDTRDLDTWLNRRRRRSTSDSGGDEEDRDDGVFRKVALKHRSTSVSRIPAPGRARSEKSSLSKLTCREILHRCRTAPYCWSACRGWRLRPTEIRRGSAIRQIPMRFIHRFGRHPEQRVV